MPDSSTNPSDLLLNKIAESNTIVSEAIKSSSLAISNTYKHIDTELGKLISTNQGGLSPDLLELNKSLLGTLFKVLESNIHTSEISPSKGDE